MIAQPQIESDVLAEARRLLDGIAREGLALRLLGGAAVFLRTLTIRHPGLERSLQDLDFVASRAHGRATADFLSRSGYAADQAFNMMNGHKRLLFHDPIHRRQVDVFVGEFSMCHSIPVEERLSLEPGILPLAELTLTKLQIVELNRKDLIDICRLFLAHDVGDGDGDLINDKRIATICSKDWGLERSLSLNLDGLVDGLGDLNLPADGQALVRKRVDMLRACIQQAPKSLKWKARAVLGERLKWYNEPDEV